MRLSADGIAVSFIGVVSDILWTVKGEVPEMKSKVGNVHYAGSVSRSMKGKIGNEGQQQGNTNMRKSYSNPLDVQSCELLIDIISVTLPAQPGGLLRSHYSMSYLACSP